MADAPPPPSPLPRAFAHIQVINLDTRPDRWAAVTAQWAALGVALEREVHRFPAVPRPDHPALGCTLSHIGVLERALADAWDSVLVCEDDFAVTDVGALRASLAVIEDAVIEGAEGAWDVLLLGGNNHRPWEPVPGAAARAAVRVRRCFTTTAYVVPRRYMRTLLDCFRAAAEGFAAHGPRAHVDWALDAYWQRLQRAHVWWLLLPPVVVQAAGYSDIERAHVDYREMFLRFDKA